MNPLELNHEVRVTLWLPVLYTHLRLGSAAAQQLFLLGFTGHVLPGYTQSFVHGAKQQYADSQYDREYTQKGNEPAQ